MQPGGTVIFQKIAQAGYCLSWPFSPQVQMPAQLRAVRGGHPGVAYPQRIIDKALHLWRRGNRSTREIADLCRVRSHQTIRRWARMSMTARAQELRAARKGPPHALSQEQELVVLGWLTFRNDHFLDTSVARLRLFIRHVLGRDLTPSWVSKFIRKHGLSDRIVQPTAPKNINRRAFREGVAFLRELQALDVEPSQVLFADTISFGIPHRGARQIAPAGSGTIHRALEQSGPPIHVYTGLVGDGRLAPFYAVINRKRGIPHVIDPEHGHVELIGKTTRRGERAVTAFIEQMLRRATLVHGDVLVTDRDRKWKTEDVEHMLASNGIRHLLYPPYLGAKLDPCDNSFHAAYRRRYNSAQLTTGTMGLATRLQVLCDLYLSSPTEAILGCIRHCGLFEADPEHTMAELLCEGRRQRRRDAAQSRHFVAAYLAYCDRTNWSEADEARARQRGDLGALLVERA